MTRLAMRQGLEYARLQALNRRDRSYLTRAHAMLLQGAGEEEFTRWVKSCAKHYGWMGWHIRDSEGILESVHTLGLDGFSEGLGVPDWVFWHEELAQSFWAELKGASGALSGRQKREIASLRNGGLVVFCWWPRDAPTVESIFRYGLGGSQ